MRNVPDGYYLSNTSDEETNGNHKFTITNSKYGKIDITKVDSKDQNNFFRVYFLDIVQIHNNQLKKCTINHSKSAQQNTQKIFNKYRK